MPPNSPVLLESPVTPRITWIIGVADRLQKSPDLRQRHKRLAIFRPTTPCRRHEPAVPRETHGQRSSPVSRETCKLTRPSAEIVAALAVTRETPGSIRRGTAVARDCWEHSFPHVRENGHAYQRHIDRTFARRRRDVSA